MQTIGDVGLVGVKLILAYFIQFGLFHPIMQVKQLQDGM